MLDGLLLEMWKATAKFLGFFAAASQATEAAITAGSLQGWISEFKMHM